MISDRRVASVDHQPPPVVGDAVITRRIGRARRWCSVAVALVALAGTARAQQPGAAPNGGARPKTAQAIEIRGQVPTPQVVTVRPRQIPTYSRAILTPAFFDRHFWQALIAPYDIVPDLSAAAGAVPASLDVPTLPADSGHRPSPADTTRHANNSAGAPPPNPMLAIRPSASDTARGSSSNAPREK